MDGQTDIDWHNDYTKINIKYSTKARLMDYRKKENKQIKDKPKRLMGVNTTVEHLLDKVERLEKENDEIKKKIGAGG